MSSYLLNIFNELFEDDGLAVVGKGLGVHTLFTKLLLYYSDQARIGRSVVFCLNCSNEDVDSIKAACYSYSINEHELPQVDQSCFNHCLYYNTQLTQTIYLLTKLIDQLNTLCVYVT